MTESGPDPGPAQRAAASVVTQRASRILLARQDSAGRWVGRSAGDVTLDAEAVLVREFLGTRRPELTRAAAQQIRSMQQPDGNWIGGAEQGRSGDLPASVLAYLALRLAGDSPDAYHLALAAGWIRDAGGLAAAGLLTSGWLAMFGLAGWDEVRVPAPELIYLPAKYAHGDGDWTGLSRQAVVSLTVIATLRRVRQLPVDLSELRPGSSAWPDRPARPRAAPVSAAQRAALRRCGQWLVNWQQRAGLPTGPRPYCTLSLVALRVLGYPLRDPVLSSGLGWIDSVTAQPRQPVGAASAPGIAAPGAAGQGRLAVLRQPPVRDTALTVHALADAGLRPDHPALVAAGSWLLSQRITGPAEAAGPRLSAAPSGWSFGRDGYPVEADTAEVLLALSRIEPLGTTGKSAITAAIRWLNGTQGRDGSWGHSAETTALVVQALATHSAPAARAIRRGVVWLVRAQLADGSWPGRYGAAELLATTDSLVALLVAGVTAGKPVIRAAVAWLLSRQNPDGGWHCGPALPDARKRPDPPLPGPGSDAAGTARAVAALLAAGGGSVAGTVFDGGVLAGSVIADGVFADGGAMAGVGVDDGANVVADAADAGADWLMRAQRTDGGWSDRPDAAGKPAGRNPARRREPLLPGMLLPLAALGQYAVSASAVSRSAGHSSASSSVGDSAGSSVGDIVPAGAATAPGAVVRPGTAEARTALAGETPAEAGKDPVLAAKEPS